MNKIKLGAWLKEYRQRHNMTMKDMAEACGFSKSYVNMLEKGVNTSTNKPVSPTLQTFEKIARATGQDIDSLLKIIDDEQLVTVSPLKISEEETQLVKNYRRLNSLNRQQISNIISAFLVQQSVVAQ